MTTTNYHSQFGEDRILDELFGRRTTGFCIEVGANDGVNDSNSYYFEQRGWRCILVEPNPELCRQIRAARSADLFECAASDRPGRATLHIAEGAERAHGVSALAEGTATPSNIAQFGFGSRPIEVEVRTLDSILASCEVALPIDFVTIDVEGFELAVLRGFDLARWQPRILILEDNANFQDRAVGRYLATQGYVPFRRSGVNDWYARRTDSELTTLGARSSYELQARGARLRRRVATIPGARPLAQMLRRLLH